MGLSKLERYYQAEFGPRDDPDAVDPPPPRPRRADRSDTRRRGPGLFKTLWLLGSLASLCTFAASALMPCGGDARPRFLPQGLVAAVCARQDMLGQILTLKEHVRAISVSMR